VIANFQTWCPISLYLVCSYAYYELDESLISDGDFDQLCKKLLEDFDDIKFFSDHPHKHLLVRENLEAGTGFSVKDYPSRVISLAKTYSGKGGKTLCQQKNQLQKRAEKVAKSASPLDDFLS
jgi:NAD-dependent DNA ligase